MSGSRKSARADTTQNRRTWPLSLAEPLGYPMNYSRYASVLS